MSIKLGILEASRAYEDATGRKLYAIRISEEDLHLLYGELCGRVDKEYLAPYDMLVELLGIQVYS